MTEARSKPIVILSLSPEAVTGDRQLKVTSKKLRIRNGCSVKQGPEVSAAPALRRNLLLLHHGRLKPATLQHPPGNIAAQVLPHTL